MGLSAVLAERVFRAIALVAAWKEAELLPLLPECTVLATFARAQVV